MDVEMGGEPADAAGADRSRLTPLPDAVAPSLQASSSFSNRNVFSCTRTSCWGCCKVYSKPRVRLLFLRGRHFHAQREHKRGTSPLGKVSVTASHQPELQKAHTKGPLQGQAGWPGVPQPWPPRKKGHRIMMKDGEDPKRCTAAPQDSNTQGEALLVNGMDRLHKLPRSHPALN